ncbi:MAG TPA: phage/plasmid primase, P4 family [Candidatus Cloacimonadota bacterium]|nr:phage/plasmid primase, P4 family [Candidatus Cloacimonadota bacterium]HPM02684.1 phage/plasmid primase, P4 family [Candidatus Cloacimonadota bacterium]
MSSEINQSVNKPENIVKLMFIHIDEQMNKFETDLSIREFENRNTVSHQYIHKYLSDSYFNVRNIRNAAYCWVMTNKKYVYCKSEKCWYKYNGKVWEVFPDTPIQAIFEFSDQIIGYLNTLDVQDENPQTKKKIEAEIYNGFRLSDLIHSNISFCEKMIKAAVNLPNISKHNSIVIDKMNTQVRYLTLQNCVLDLKTFSLYPHDKQFYSKDMLDYRFPEKQEELVECPLFLKFTEEIFLGKPNIRNFIIKLLGYILYPANIEEKFIYFYGKGRNGKSVFLNTISKVLKQFSTGIEAYTLIDCKSDNAKVAHQKALLKDKLFAIVDENDKHYKLSEKAIKQLSSKDPINIERKFKDPEQIENTCLIIAPVNHLPEISMKDTSIERRLVYIPFERQFTDKDDDKRLQDKLINEAEGIFHLMLISLFDYIQNELQIPEELTEYKNECMNDANPFEQFIEDFELGEYTDYISFKDLYQKYIKFYANDFYGSGIKLIGKKDFKDSLIMHGFIIMSRDSRHKNNAYVYKIKEKSNLEYNQQITLSNYSS